MSGSESRYGRWSETAWCNDLEAEPRRIEAVVRRALSDVEHQPAALRRRSVAAATTVVLALSSIVALVLVRHPGPPTAVEEEVGASLPSGGVALTNIGSVIVVRSPAGAHLLSGAGAPPTNSRMILIAGGT